MKGQVLANFVAKFSPKNEGEIVCHVECRTWKVFMDGALSAMGAGVRIVVIKEYLTRAPILTTPEPREDLFMYLLVFNHAVSVVLLKDQGVQQPV